jgi:hypothetical protein
VTTTKDPECITTRKHDECTAIHCETGETDQCWEFYRESQRRVQRLIERGTWDPDCAYCQQHVPGSMMPSHTASPRCQSGSRNHCTCDTCF